MAVDLNRVESNVRRAYERARFLHAVKTSAPLLCIAVLVSLVDRRPAVVLGIGGLLFVTDALFVWRGQQFGRGALAGLTGGAIPLVFGLCMQLYQRWYGGMLLTPGCTALCTAGGVLAGLWITWLARRQPSPLAFAFAAGTTALLLGSIGCACAGIAGAFGLLGGLAIPIISARVRPQVGT